MALTTAETFTWNGQHLTTYAYNISTYGGRLSLPATRGDNYVLPGRSGSMYVPNKPYEEGVFTLNMWVVGTDSDGNVPSDKTRRLLFEENKEHLIRTIFSKRYGLNLVQATRADGTVRAAECEIIDAVDWTTMSAGMRGEFTIQCRIPEVFWRSASSVTTSAYSVGTSTLTEFNGATAEMEDATFVVTGPITNPRLTDFYSGIYAEYTGVLSSGQSWTLNSGAFTSSHSANGNVLASTRHVGHVRFLPLTVPVVSSGFKAYRLTLSGSGTTSSTTVTVTGNTRYLTP